MGLEEVFNFVGDNWIALSIGGGLTYVSVMSGVGLLYRKKAERLLDKVKEYVGVFERHPELLDNDDACRAYVDAKRTLNPASSGVVKP